MSVKENLEADKLLQLNLGVNWSPHLPQILWKGLKLTPESKNGSSLDLSPLSLAEALRTCHVEMDYLNFLMLGAFIRENLKEGKKEEAEKEILSLEKIWPFRWSEEAYALYSLFKRLPSPFQIWAREKKLAFNDLRPLLRGEMAALDPFLKKLSDIQASKSVGVEILEKLCDLTEEELTQARFLLSENTAQAWLRFLKEQTLPLTSNKDQKRQEKVRTWPWPARVKGEWKRSGDQAGLFVEIYSSHPEDLKMKLKDLEELCERWRKEL